MDLQAKTSLQSPANSRTKIALEFLRIDKARLNSGKTPVPLPTAIVERQRKQLVNKRYKACMMARHQASRENEMRLRDNREAVMKDLKSNPKSSTDKSEPDLLPWPGFRYHNNGEVRTLNNLQKQRRLMGSMKAGQGHRQSTLDVPWLSSADSKDDSGKTFPLSKGRSVDAFKMLKPNPKEIGLASSLDRFPKEIHTSSSTSNGLSPKASLPTTFERRKYDYGSHRTGSISKTKFSPSVERKVSFNNKVGNVYSVPSNRSIHSTRVNLNQFGPAVKVLTTSSMWCNGGEELKERASLIPKDSFNIKFGVSSKVLHQRKSDLDEYRTLQEKRSSENAQNVKKYIDNVKKRIY